ncbi:fam-a protein [Plasmodium vinckei brucechwatti]|uniref:Fam-a protein n=1 Tax=Plasmodium vinckei brucechwatti TaxID=119398 RepID=A0A6V7SSE0_PLAVN|nr:fam-a protein [Plasmodium vinckei brucechwatti]
MNKWCIKIVFYLLIMLVCMSDNSLANEDTPEIYSIRKFALRSKTQRNSALRKQIPHIIPSCEIYEQNTHLLYTNRKETHKATQLMDEAATLLQYYASNINDYDLYQKYDDDVSLYFKKRANPDVGKLNFKIPVPDAYEDIINLLWNPNAPYNFCNDFVNGKIVRVYDPNLVMIQHRYTNRAQSIQGYFYALAKKTQVSEDTTIIVMSSANINDHHPSTTEYKNKIIENANLFKTDIDSEDDIRNGKLIKMFVSISGFIIKKEDTHVDITHIDSIDCNCPNIPWWYIQKVKAMKMLDVVKLKQIFDEK